MTTRGREDHTNIDPELATGDTWNNRQACSEWACGRSEDTIGASHYLDDLAPVPVEAEAPSGDEPGRALLQQVRDGDERAFETLMRRHNQRLFRVARAVVKCPTEAEDVVQQAYVSVFLNAHKFGGRSSLSTWLTRITLNEALGRLRRKGRDLAQDPDFPQAVHDLTPLPLNPEEQVLRREVVVLIESLVDGLPEDYRVVFALRELEGVPGTEVAESLGISAEAVRVRLHRARAMLRDQLHDALGSSLAEVFKFGGQRCDRIVASVLATVRRDQTTVSRR